MCGGSEDCICTFAVDRVPICLDFTIPPFRACESDEDCPEEGATCVSFDECGGTSVCGFQCGFEFAPGSSAIVVNPGDGDDESTTKIPDSWF